jgi:lipopolysaccharide heptosyltransferase I
MAQQLAYIANDPRIRRILIIKPSSLGDVVHALPVLAALRSQFPQAHISWMVASSFAPLLIDHPLLDEVLLFDRKHYGRLHRSGRSAGDFVGFVRGLATRRFDLVIDLQGLFRSGLFARLTGARYRVGFADVRELAGLFYTHRIRVPATIRHAVDRNVHLARTIGLPIDRPAFPLAVSLREIQAANARLADAAGHFVPRFIAVVIAARWPTKQWAPERFAALLDRLHAENAPPCVLLGAPDEREVAARVSAATDAPLINLVGQTSLRELTALLDRSERVITNDSGPMHLAAALGKPIVALFGPTDPQRCGPYGAPARVVRSAIPCLGCYRRTCWHHTCLRELSVDRVATAMHELDGVVFGRTPRVAALSR